MLLVVKELPSTMGWSDTNIRVWLLDTGKVSLSQEHLSLLSFDELERAKQYKSDPHRQQFSATRIALRQLLGRELHCHPKKIQFDYTQWGRPVVKQPATRLHFNISHSDTISLIVFAYDSPVGIDIERQRQEIDPIRIANTIFCLREVKRLQQSRGAERLALFYRIWTIKEAVLKMLGTGFSLNSREFCIDDALASGNHILTLPYQQLENTMPRQVKVMELDLGRHHSGALVVAQ